MQEVRFAKVNNREIPILISDETEALLAAKAAGRAIVGLWRPDNGTEQTEQEQFNVRGQGQRKGQFDISAAPYAVTSLADVDETFLERVARRHLGLPWKICESERLLIREIAWDDFDELWENKVGHGFGSMEELEAYTKHQYAFYEFGFWALVEKDSGNLIGAAGFTLPEKTSGQFQILTWQGTFLESETAEGGLTDGGGMDSGAASAPGAGPGLTLELGYWIFPPYRRRGYGREACKAVMEYAKEELFASDFLVRIRPDNLASLGLAASLGFA